MFNAVLLIRSLQTIIQQGRIACRIPLKFKDAEGFEFSESPDIHQNILFECSVSRSDVKVEALYTPVDGHRYCVIYTDYVDAKETSARLAVMAYDNSRSYSTTAQQSITFASTFIINGPQEVLHICKLACHYSLLTSFIYRYISHVLNHLPQ